MFVEVNMKLTFCADEMPFRAFVSHDNEKTDTPSTWETRVCFAYSGTGYLALPFCVSSVVLSPLASALCRCL